TFDGPCRTPCVALSGANGTKLWDVRQQGWGFAQRDGATNATQRFLAYGLVDVPTKPRRGERFPPKLVRMGVLDGADGSTLWSYERAFAQNSYLSYNLALAQFATALAPLDADHDGFLDLVTPAQYAPITGIDQTLLATSSHSYQLLSGLDGATMQTYDAWGPTGRLLDCGGQDGLTFLTGHARRLEVARYDPSSGAKQWRSAIWSDPSPHAASAGVDTVALGAAC